MTEVADTGVTVTGAAGGCIGSPRLYEVTRRMGVIRWVARGVIAALSRGISIGFATEGGAIATVFSGA